MKTEKESKRPGSYWEHNGATMTIKRNQNASVRIWAQNPDHHLYKNNGTWWVHYTSYPTPVTTGRVRRSLRTHDVETARARRDALFGELFHESGKEVAA